jgi:monoamine oxidase
LDAGSGKLVPGRLRPSVKTLETMKQLTRRSFLAGSAAVAAAPALAAPASFVDVVVVGAGAAGIAAARRIAAGGRRVTVLEATDHVGGRCVTDTRTFGVPFDRGAHWIHVPDLNPVAKLAPASGVEIYPAPRGQTLRIGRRNGREGELEDFLSTLVRANRAIAEAARGKSDITAAQALPKDLGDWRATIEYVLGPYAFAKDLADLSAYDVARSAERDTAAFCRQGFGALLARLAGGLQVQLSTPVTRIDWGSTLEVDTARGRIGARAVIVTVSTGVLAAGRIRFTPDLPKRSLDAVNRLKLGSLDHIAIELAGGALDLQQDELVFEKASDARTAAMLANIGGTPLCTIEVGGRFGRELAGRGEAEMTAFAGEWLAHLYGNDVKRAIRRTSVTRWNEDPWTLGAVSAAAPGGQPSRRVLMEPLRDRIWFAGEAAHETLWGTVGGAWESGERAADAVLKRLAPAPAKRPQRSRRSGR